MCVCVCVCVCVCALTVKVLAKWEIERGRCLAVRAEIGDSVFVFR